MSVKSRTRRTIRKQLDSMLREDAWIPAADGSPHEDGLNLSAVGIQSNLVLRYGTTESTLEQLACVHDALVWRDAASRLGMRVLPDAPDTRDPLPEPMDVAELFRIARATFRPRKVHKARVASKARSVEPHAPEYRTLADHQRAVQNARIAASLAGTW
jgi:hypothetical protein